MDFLSGPDPGDLHLATRRDGFHQVHDVHTGDLGHENLPAVHDLQTLGHEIHTLIQGYPEPGHAFVGNAYGAGGFLVEEQRNHAAPAGHHVSVAGTAKAGFRRARVRVSLHEKLFGA